LACGDFEALLKEFAQCPCGQKTQPNNNYWLQWDLGRHRKSRFSQRCPLAAAVGSTRRTPRRESTMRFVLQPWQPLLSIVVGWFNDEQQKINEYQRTVIQVLLEKMGKKRILLNDHQRRCLAVKGKILGRKVLAQVGALFTPDTILRWHRELVAQKWDHSAKRRKVGRPPTAQEVVDLILQFAKENPSWGYDRIADALANVGHTVSDQTVGNVLKGHGIEPAPERKRTTTWATFLKSHWDQLGGLLRYYYRQAA
jgi:putative transposase